MTRRSVSPYFASLLLIVQLLVAPFAHAEAIDLGDVDCAGMAQDQTPPTMGGDDCEHMTPGADQHCQQGDQGCHRHAICSCPCAHTPALGTTRNVVDAPTPPAAGESAPVVRAFQTPIFKLLRPPQ